MSNQISTSIVQVPEPNITITDLQIQALGFLKYASERTVSTVEDTRRATEDLSIIARAKKALEEKRKEYVSPLNEQIKYINDTFKLVSEPLAQADKRTRDKILAFNAEQERQRQEAERINTLRMEAAKAEMELKGELTESVNLVEVPQEVSKRVQTDIGTVGQRDNWKWEVIDINEVPREYLMINAGMLTPIVKASKGKLTIPGINIYNEKTMVVTTH